MSVTPDQAIVFPSVSFIRNLVSKVARQMVDLRPQHHQVSKAGRRQEDRHMPVVIQCEHINKADFTAASGFKAMVEDFEGREQPVSLLGEPDLIQTFPRCFG